MPVARVLHLEALGVLGEGHASKSLQAQGRCCLEAVLGHLELPFGVRHLQVTGVLKRSGYEMRNSPIDTIQC